MIKKTYPLKKSTFQLVHQNNRNVFERKINTLNSHQLTFIRILHKQPVRQTWTNYIVGNNLTEANVNLIFIVPFIDTQPVEASVPKPLIGAGIYYKTTHGYGGFIGPLIILHDD